MMTNHTTVLRVNLRKVMAEGKSMDRKEAERQAKMDKREKEARYVCQLYVIKFNNG